MQNGQGIGRSRLASNGDENAAATGEDLENAAVVCLKSDAAHRARNAQLGEIAGRALQRLDERSARDRWTNGGDFNALPSRSAGVLNKRWKVWTLFRDDTEGGSWKTCLLERGDAFSGPRHVLEHPDGETSCFDVNHGRNVSRRPTAPVVRDSRLCRRARVP
jgi:hypothetical protein